jgi:hypothetical protein
LRWSIVKYKIKFDNMRQLQDRVYSICWCKVFSHSANYFYYFHQLLQKPKIHGHTVKKKFNLPRLYLFRKKQQKALKVTDFMLIFIKFCPILNQCFRQTYEIVGGGEFQYRESQKNNELPYFWMWRIIRRSLCIRSVNILKKKYDPKLF